MSDLLDQFAFLRGEHTQAAEKYFATHDIKWFETACEIFEKAMTLAAAVQDV